VALVDDPAGQSANRSSVASATVTVFVMENRE
jgi:hypothetical protein